MSTPPQGAQISFFGGAVPASIHVSASAATGKDLFFVSSQSSIPFERPAFSLASSTYALSAGSAPGTSVTISLAPGTPAGIPYTVAGAAQGGGGYFHPIASSGTKVACAVSGTAYPSTQVYVTPIDTGSKYVPLAVVDACQFCPSITGTADCSAAPLATPNPMTGPITVVVKNVAIDPDLGAPAGVPLPLGHYAVTVIEPTGQSWTVPNTLNVASPAQGAVFTVTQ
jgi:hypothetical protein